VTALTVVVRGHWNIAETILTSPTHSDRREERRSDRAACLPCGTSLTGLGLRSKRTSGARPYLLVATQPRARDRHVPLMQLSWWRPADRPYQQCKRHLLVQPGCSAGNPQEFRNGRPPGTLLIHPPGSR
jgi:hypothetical protein